jgi:phosphomannomutase
MKFGTSGLRGLVSDMTDPVCGAYAAAFVEHVARSGRRAEAVLIGRDLRPSSPRIAAACAEAARRAGAAAMDCGVLPTPALALESAARGLPAIMITGSHIPFDRNGVKFYRDDGSEITKADEAGILAALGSPSRGAVPAPVADGVDARRRYVARALDFFPADLLADWRVGVWQHSAAGRDVVVEILDGLGAETVPLGRSDAFVPIDTEAVSEEDAARARDWTREHALDALVTTDGDGDRPLIADETGAWMRGDVLGVLTAAALGADAVATPVSSNTALELSGRFDRVIRTRIGSPYVIEAMAQLTRDGARLPVGYEANGGFLLGAEAEGRSGRRLAPLPTRDAMLPMLAVLEDAARRRAPLSALLADLPARFTASDRLREVPAERSGPFLEVLRDDPAARAAFVAAAFDGAAILGVDATDGVRMTLAGGGIAHLRASGNAPELRCYAEAESQGRAREIVACALAAAAARIGG